MSRPLRIAFADAIYHVTSRGNDRQAIVADEADRDRWVLLLRRTVEAYGWRMFALALMDNHFHLFLQTPEPNLSAGMHALTAGYATSYNRRHGRVGHVFQGRFKAVLVESRGHWRELSRYVHLNPVRAGLAGRPEDWRWSSYAGYHRPARRLAWVDYRRVLRPFGGDTASGRRGYRRYVEAGMGRTLDSPLAQAVHGLVLGSDRFVARIRDMVDARPADRDVPQVHRLRSRPSVNAVAAAVAAHFGADRSRWRVGRRCDAIARSMAAYLGRTLARARAVDVAAALGYRDPSSVSHACHRVEASLKRPPVARALRHILRQLKESRYSQIQT